MHLRLQGRQEQRAGGGPGEKPGWNWSRQFRAMNWRTIMGAGGPGRPDTAKNLLQEKEYPVQKGAF